MVARARAAWPQRLWSAALSSTVRPLAEATHLVAESGQLRPHGLLALLQLLQALDHGRLVCEPESQGP